MNVIELNWLEIFLQIFKSDDISFTACNLFTAKQLKTQTVEVIPLNGHDANLDRQDGLEEAPLHDAVFIGVAIEYLERE